MKTIIISGPKRSGTTLINRLFDSQPNVVDLIDEAFFWEHVYKFSTKNEIEIFVDLFKTFSPKALFEGFVVRDILPWVQGIYRQAAVKNPFELDLEFNTDLFVSLLENVKNEHTVVGIWRTLVHAYACASKSDYSDSHTVIIKSADYGSSILAVDKYVKDYGGVLIIRNPLYAIDSLKKSRSIRQEKQLNPFTLAEVVSDYLFLWNNLSDILKCNTVLVKYEDLLVNPKQVMSDLAEHIGIGFTENLLHPTLQGKAWSGLSSFAITSGIDSSSLHRPIKTLHEDEISFIEKSLFDMLCHFQYTREAL